MPSITPKGQKLSQSGLLKASQAAWDEKDTVQVLCRVTRAEHASLQVRPQYGANLGRQADGFTIWCYAIRTLQIEGVRIAALLHVRLISRRQVTGCQLVRLGFDWVEVVVSDNHFSLHERVLPAYLAAYEVLHRTHFERAEVCKQGIAKVTNEEEYGDARCNLNDEEYRWQEQTQALATMALTLMASTNKSFLDQMKALFATTHPAQSHYPGKSQLLKQMAEYKARFGIDLGIVPHFSTIREVELARHCCIHNDGRLSEDYSGQTGQRLVGAHGYIDLTPEMLAMILSEIGEFAHALSVEMKRTRVAGSKVGKGDKPQ